MNHDISQLDGARLVRTDSLGGGDHLVCAWFGGTTINIYETYDGLLREVDVMSLSDDKGRPCNQYTVDGHIADYFEREQL